tara:strand:+ start:514 stop:714 length:201 start_codon:yes stop_codon:yes gene_type:complete
MSKQSQEELDEKHFRFHWRNARIVSAACDRYFARKGLKSYDLKGNQINPVTKQLLDPHIPKKRKKP